MPADVHGKVTGKAKYAEDFRAEGMVFCKLLLSPMPHARVRNVDVGAALALPGVLGVLRASDVTQLPAPAEPILTDEPMWIGQPVLAVAAETEQIAADAIDLIKVDFEELPFTVDPLQSLYPGGPDARTNGNIANPGVDLKVFKWTAQDFARAQEGQLPEGSPVREWSYGDVEAGLGRAALVLDETFVTAGVLTIVGATGLPTARRLVALYGAGLVAAGAFVADPMDGFPVGTPPGPPTTVTWHGMLHFMAGGIGFLGLIAACLVLARRFGRAGRRGWAVYSAATGVLFTAAFVGIAAWQKRRAAA